MSSELFSREYFESLHAKLFPRLRSGEHLSVAFAGESSQFIRINGAKVRQIGTVSEAIVTLTLVLESTPSVNKDTLRRSSRSLTLTGLRYTDDSELEHALRALQDETRELPPDPYAQIPKNRGQNTAEKSGRILSPEGAPDALLPLIQKLDLAGIYAAGRCARGFADSAGTAHWFSIENFGFDYSIYTPSQRAVKGTFAGQNWDTQAFLAQLMSDQSKLARLDQPARRIERGGYRVFLEPAAFSDLIQMLSWGALSEASIRQGESPLQKIRAGTARMSPRFTLAEDFRGGESPRFNSEGELAAETLTLFEAGALKESLVSSRTAKEYGVTSNLASEDEAQRAPSVAAGDLREADVLARLGTGLYLSNLHYLNWSDQSGGRITGMTRFACFWVENGEVVSPIENMRFDDTIFRFFGESLEALTERRQFLPNSRSYGMRSLGGSWIPGALLSEMTFTI